MKPRQIQYLWALFFLGLMIFNYPILSLFNVKGTLFGLPVFYLLLFGLWGLLIGLGIFWVKTIKEREHD